MTKLAQDLMTPDPACCTAHTTVDEVAKLMVKNNCGEIPVIGIDDRPIGVITDRDIVCRVVADGKNPMGYTVDTCMTQPVVTVTANDSIDRVLSVMESHQIRRVLVVDDDGCCCGIISQADIARGEPWREVAALVREVSNDFGQASR